MSQQRPAAALALVARAGLVGGTWFQRGAWKKQQLLGCQHGRVPPGTSRQQCMHLLCISSLERAGRLTWPAIWREGQAACDCLGRKAGRRRGQLPLRRAHMPATAWLIRRCSASRRVEAAGQQGSSSFGRARMTCRARRGSFLLSWHRRLCMRCFHLPPLLWAFLHLLLLLLGCRHLLHLLRRRLLAARGACHCWRCQGTSRRSGLGRVCGNGEHGQAIQQQISWQCSCVDGT